MSNEPGINKICEILASPKFPQITGTYAQFDEDDNITGKCALGEVACGVGLKIQHRVDLLRLEVKDIIAAAGVERDLNTFTLPSIDYRLNQNFDFECYDTIGKYIYYLNDAGYTYPQIIEFLQTTFP